MKPKRTFVKPSKKTLNDTVFTADEQLQIIKKIQDTVVQVKPSGNVTRRRYIEKKDDPINLSKIIDKNLEQLAKERRNWLSDKIDQKMSVVMRARSIGELTTNIDFSMNSLAKQIINKTVAFKTLKDIFIDYCMFTKSKTANTYGYYGKYNQHIIDLCFTHFPDMFQKSEFEAIENYRKQNIIDRIGEDFEIKGTDTTPKYAEWLFDHVKPSRDVDSSSKAINIVFERNGDVLTNKSSGFNKKIDVE